MHDLVAERVAAVRAKDSRPLAARQHPDVITFDVLPPLHTRGRATDAARTQEWFDAYATDIGYEVHDLHVTAAGDLGFCSFLYHVTGTLAAGGEVDMWVRATLCCRRIDGKWLITHDHESMPFDAIDPGPWPATTALRTDKRVPVNSDRSDQTEDAARVQTLIESWAKAISAGDRASILAHHAHDVQMFDFPPIVRGVGEYDRTWDFSSRRQRARSASCYRSSPPASTSPSRPAWSTAKAPPPARSTSD